MDENLYLGLMKFSRNVAKAIEKAIDCKRVGITVIGLEVPHAHVHLIPLNDMDDMRFVKKVILSEDEFKSIADSIKMKL